MTGQTMPEAIYSQVIKPLPLSQRLQLAKMILNDIPPQAVVNYSEEWAGEDMRDATLYSFRRAGKSLGEEA